MRIALENLLEERVEIHLKNVNPPVSSLDKTNNNGSRVYFVSRRRSWFSRAEQRGSLGLFQRFHDKKMISRNWRRISDRPTNRAEHAAASGRRAVPGKGADILFLRCWMQAGGELNHGRQNNLLVEEQSDGEK